jgi:preprotein translocase subunit SecB
MNLLNSTPGTTTQYKIARLYLKSASVEVPHMANLPQQAMSPQVGVDMQTEATPVKPGVLECVLRVSLHARLEGRNVFMLEVSEAGWFELNISNMEEAHHFVRQIAPSVLFPFARKDLANLAVSAGFQPVLLDHVDFNTLLTQVIKSQRHTRVSAPMRVDVIAAKPTIPSAPILETEAQEDEDSDWHDTMPSTYDPEPVAEPKTEPVQKKRNRVRGFVLGLLGLASLGAMLAWWMEPDATARKKLPITAVQQPSVLTLPPALPASAISPISAAATVSAALPASAQQPATKVPEKTQTALAISQARLAEQPATWFTLDLGTVPATAELEGLTPELPDRPLFVVTKGEELRMLYGVFPSQAAAELVRKQLPQAATVVSIGSL